MEIGKARYGSGKKTHKIKDGDNIYRILPPMGKLAKQGRWNQYYKVEWGYKGSDGKNKPFQDVRVVNRQTKMVEVESAAHLRREALKKQKESIVTSLRADPTNQDLREQLKQVSESIKRYNLESKYYVNAVNTQGEIGLLKLGYRAFQALKSEIDRLLQQGVDPLSVDNGRFFNFYRSGRGLDTTYTVTVYKENVEVNGEVYQKDKVHKMDEAFISRLENEAFELSGMYPTVTAAQVEKMVKEGAPAVDQILGKANVSEDLSDDDSEEDSGSSSSTTTTQASSAPAVEEKKEASTPPVEQKQSSPAQPAQSQSDVGAMSDEEFLNFIEQQ